MSSPDADFVGSSSTGFNPFPDNDQIEASRKALESEVAKNFDVLNDIVELLTKQIDFYARSVDSVPVEVQTKPAEFMHVVAANRLTRDNLANVKESITALIDEFKKK